MLLITAPYYDYTPKRHSTEADPYFTLNLGRTNTAQQPLQYYYLFCSADVASCYNSLSLRLKFLLQNSVAEGIYTNCSSAAISVPLCFIS